MAPGKYDISIYQGDSFSLSLTLKDSSGAVYVLTGWTAKAQLRLVNSDPTEDPALEFTCAITALTGVITVSAAAALTAVLVPGRYRYDVQITDGTLVNTVVNGVAVVVEEVTKP